MTTRILITGCRHWHPTALVDSVVARLLQKHGPDLVIVHGAAPGIDQTFAAACDALDVDQEQHPADWDTYGRRAGPLRNEDMVKRGATLCIAFHRDIKASKGTRGAARLAIAAGIPTWLVEDEGGEPRRLRMEDLE